MADDRRANLDSPVAGPKVTTAILAGTIAGIVALIALLAFDPPLTLALDNAGLFYGKIVEAYRAWSSGRVPEWSDSFWAGFALLGDSTAGALYPPNFLACWLTPPPHVRLFDLLVAMHMGLLVAGSVHLLALLGVRGAGLAVGAFLALTCATPLHGGVAYVPVLAAVSWWPWGCVAAERLARPGTRMLGGAMVLGWVALAAQVLAGVPEQATYGASLAAVWLLTRRAGLGLGARVMRLVVLGAGATAIAAPQLLATAAYLPSTLRSKALDTRLAQVASITLTDPLALLVPGRNAWTFVPAFFGVATVALAIVGGASWRARGIFLIVAATTTFLLAIGPRTPLYALLHMVPPFDRFRTPQKFQSMAELLLAWVAALGFDALARSSRTGMRVVALLLAVGVLGERIGYLVWDELPLLQGLDRGRRNAVDVVAAYENTGLPKRRGRNTPPPLVLDSFGGEPSPIGTNLTGVVGIAGLTGNAGALPSRLSLSVMTPPPKNRAAFDLFGVQFIVASRRKCARFMGRLEWPVVHDTDALCVLENPRRPPRHALLGAVTPVESEADMVAAVRADPSRPIPVVGPPTTVVEPVVAARDVAMLSSYQPGRTLLFTSVQSERLLLVRETWVPGWEAHTDGRSVPLYQAAGAYFAALVPPGTHWVELVYRAPGFRPGLVIALAWCVGSLVLWIGLRWRRRT